MIAYDPKGGRATHANGIALRSICLERSPERHQKVTLACPRNDRREVTIDGRRQHILRRATQLSCSVRFLGMTLDRRSTDQTKAQQDALSFFRNLWPRIIDVWIGAVLVAFFLIRVLGSSVGQHLLNRFLPSHSG